jgi:hypothetical protein
VKRTPPPGLDPEYQRLRDMREERRREIDALTGFHDEAPYRAYSKRAARRAAMRSARRRRSGQQ